MGERKNAKIKKVCLQASICEIAEGRKYGGIFNIGDAPAASYEISYKRRLGEIVSDPIDLVKNLEFRVRNQKTSEEMDLCEHSKYELAGIATAGAKSIDEGRYLEVNGIKTAYCKTEIERTAAIDKILEGKK